MIEKKILVLGCGSVGKRHIQNLLNLNSDCEISIFDPNAQRVNETKDKFKIKNSYTNYDDLLNYKSEFNGLVIASPPRFHITQALDFIDENIIILMEKPLSRTLDEALKLKKFNNDKILLGYTYRWWEPLIELKKMLNSNTVGNIKHVKFVMSAHLSDWHPWEKYTDFFMASKDLGGGALLDESHFIDLMYWFFGMPKEVFATVEKISNLEIETDDNVDMIIRYDNLRVNVHLDLYGRPHEKFISITGEEGTIVWSFDPNQIKLSKDMLQNWEIKKFNFERNDMFVNVVKEFVAAIENKKNKFSCTYEDGLQVLKILEACRLSQDTSKMITL